MSGLEQPRMVDEQYRGLLTDREREILAGEADVSDNYRYRVVSRTRTKLNALETDIEILEEHHPELLEEIRAVVCENADESDE